MKRPDRGFTLVELIVVIVVIGILAAIVIVAWGGLITRSNDKARETDTRTWASTFELYRTRLAVYPVMSTNMLTPAWACLGSFSSTNNKCGQYNSIVPGQYYADSSSPDVTAVSSKPVNSGQKLYSSVVGPIVYVTQNQNSSPITITANFLNYFQVGCPSDFTDVTNNATYAALIPTLNPNHVYLCDLQKTFTY